MFRLLTADTRSPTASNALLPAVLFPETCDRQKRNKQQRVRLPKSTKQVRPLVHTRPRCCCKSSDRTDDREQVRQPDKARKPRPPACQRYRKLRPGTQPFLCLWARPKA